MNKNLTREKIINAADILFYQQGFEHTSFSQIATQVKISRGNFYYHFKTKDGILSAVIEQRLKNTSTMLTQWQIKNNNPADRIRSFINILMLNKNKIEKFGCPVGTLSSELIKLNHSAKEDAKEIFTLFRNWLKQQFTELNHHQNADMLAMHLLARSQGIATLASAFNDKDYIKQEVDGLNTWLNSYIDPLHHKNRDQLCS